MAGRLFSIPRRPPPRCPITTPAHSGAASPGGLASPISTPATATAEMTQVEPTQVASLDQMLGERPGGLDVMEANEIGNCSAWFFKFAWPRIPHAMPKPVALRTAGAVRCALLTVFVGSAWATAAGASSATAGEALAMAAAAAAAGVVQDDVGTPDRPCTATGANCTIVMTHQAGGLSHVLMMASIGKELARRGHRVLYLAPHHDSSFLLRDPGGMIPMVTRTPVWRRCCTLTVKTAHGPQSRRGVG
jgi:hypothetical protein